MCLTGQHWTLVGYMLGCCILWHMYHTHSNVVLFQQLLLHWHANSSGRVSAACPQKLLLHTAVARTAYPYALCCSALYVFACGLKQILGNTAVDSASPSLYVSVQYTLQQNLYLHRTES